MGIARSWQLLIQAFKTSYEHIGKVMLTNVIWFGLGFAPFLAITYLPIENNILFLAAVLATFFTLGSATAAVHAMMNAVIQGEEVSWRDFGQGIKQFFGRGTLVLLAAALGFGILFFNIWVSSNNPSTLFTILAGFWLWGILFWSSVQQFAYPFLANQDIGFLLIIKRAALISLDNPLASALLLIFSVVVLAISVLLVAPLLIFTVSFLALLQNYYYHELMLKYETGTGEGQK